MTVHCHSYFFIDSVALWAMILLKYNWMILGHMSSKPLFHGSYRLMAISCHIWVLLAPFQLFSIDTVSASYVQHLVCYNTDLIPAGVCSCWLIYSLSVLSKLLSAWIVCQLVFCISAANLLSELQSAYQDRWLRLLFPRFWVTLQALDTGDVAILTLLHLSAAFDTVDHAMSLQHLEMSYDLGGYTLRWFTLYPCGCIQYICQMGRISEIVWRSRTTVPAAIVRVGGRSTVGNRRLRNSCRQVCYMFETRTASAFHWNWTAVNVDGNPSSSI